MDGTFIPDNPESKIAVNELKKYLKQKNFKIIYVTGRSLSGTKDAIIKFSLPKPSSIICDVGTTIYHKKFGIYLKDKNYSTVLDNICINEGTGCIFKKVEEIKNIVPQEKFRQKRHKISFYYDINEYNYKDLSKKLSFQNWEIVTSHDNRGVGFLDVLPKGINKLAAINWYIENFNIKRENVFFAGDSGNDLAVFESDIKSIVVNNCSNDIKNLVKERKNIYISSSNSTKGVLEGLVSFGILK